MSGEDGQEAPGSPHESAVVTARPATRRKRATPSVPDAGDAPPVAVARVVVDSSLPHLDRLFDYAIPEALIARVSPGVRVRVRFAGVRTDAWVLEVVAHSDHPGRLARIDSVISALPVLTPEVAALCRAVADRWAGTLPDVLRAAVPPRHARVEAEPTGDGPAVSRPAPTGADDPWRHYRDEPDDNTAPGDAASTPAPSVACLVAPGDSPHEMAAWALATGGGGALAVVPDVRDVRRVVSTLHALVDPDRVVALTADVGPAERYRRWLRVLRGHADLVVGTRAAAFAPVADLRAVVILDDGDDLHAEPHAPYWHAREVLAIRAHQQGAAFVAISRTRTAEVHHLVSSGWVRSVQRPRTEVRSRTPRITATGDDIALARDEAARSARLPSRAFEAIRNGLERGPVLVSVARGGYVPRLSCQDCRTVLACPHCAGAVAVPSAREVPACLRCGRLLGALQCPSCGSTRRRALVVGAFRTAEEIGRAFPGTEVRTSGQDRVIDEVPDRTCLVVATPGAEPTAAAGFAAAVILDARLSLERADLRAGEEALRRWTDVAARVRSASQGGEVVVVADSGLAAVQALIRWDPAGAAAREWTEREHLRMPPAARTVELLGAASDVEEVRRDLGLPAHAHVLGPVPVAGDPEGRVRLYASVPRAEGASLSAAVKAAMAGRSARKEPGRVQARIDPVAIG